MRTLALCFSANVLLASCAFSQQADSVQQRNACRLAAQVIRTGQPAPHRSWALEEIVRCGSEGGMALADAMRQHRRSVDATFLDQLTAPAATLRDANVAAAALEAVAERTASVQARVFAFRVLIDALSPGRILTYPQLTGASDVPQACFGLPASLHFQVADGAPLPSDFQTRVAAVAGDVLRDSSAPQEVRRAAACTRAYTRS